MGIMLPGNNGIGTIIETVVKKRKNVRKIGLPFIIFHFSLILFFDMYHYSQYNEGCNN